MTDIESELREAMRSATAGAQPSRDVLELFCHRRRRRRNALTAAASAAAGAAAVAIVFALVAGVSAWPAGARPPVPVHPSQPAFSGRNASRSAAPPVQTPPIPPVPGGWVRHSDAAGDSIDTPAAWQVTTPGIFMTPDILWLIGTGPVPAGGDCGSSVPTAALHRLSADGMLLTLQKADAEEEPYDFPPRTGRLSIGPLGGPYECWGVRLHRVLFEDDGFYLEADTIFGARAPASLRNEVTRSLNTLRIATADARRQPAALCRAGQWTYCPQAVWVNSVLSKAGLPNFGNEGTQGIYGGVGHRSFAIWTTQPPRPAGRCHSVSGTTVCQVGSRLVWRAHGLLLWLEPSISPYTTSPVRAGLPTAAALLRLVQAAQRTPVPTR